ncbi:conserved exported hypothetical protein [Desulfosarcina cetonica]|uniref:DUF1329 domain-containing protein n=1 Tax=Desulfosarcina cetonica TaxID=90730 RepID=UPI000A4331D7|nr:DUF1329 domain-containing protein [Desulfosarcina cetonica]VTR70417.1 conserved exported hypothetical protein [Desulfosarcina cetonica]
MKFKASIFALMMLATFGLLTQEVIAMVVAEKAEQLKSTLTPVGAERAGNADGTIPAWDGGYTAVPADYTSGDLRPDPFAEEKPLFSIKGENVEKYADKLSDGTLALLKKYPNFRLDIFPTHRTAAAPQYVYEAIYKNATHAKLTKDHKVEGAYNGIPFPIPQNGYEVIWNHILSWRGVSHVMRERNYIITREGKIILTTEMEESNQFPYYRKDISAQEWNKKFWYYKSRQTAPPFKAGETILTHEDLGETGRQTWQYLVGQRRVRRAPSISYDTPDFVNSGHNFFDEVYVFNGNIDRYEFTLKGKKEVYIPYNCNGFLSHEDEAVLGANYLNPDYVRWELHRVWVVQADLAPGKRHAVHRRVFYIDEDTWRAVLLDGWDGQNVLWRSTISLPIIAMEYPEVLNYTQAVYNHQSGAYGVNMLLNGFSKQLQAVSPHPDTFFSPETLAATGVR